MLLLAIFVMPSAMAINIVHEAFYQSFFSGPPANVTQLNTNNFNQISDGKLLMLNFCSPWAVACKVQRPTWLQLANQFDRDGILFGDIDCDGAGMELCERYEIDTLPAIMYGDLDRLKSYKANRHLHALRNFLKFQISSTRCVPSSRERCTQDEEMSLARYVAIGKDELSSAISKAELQVLSIESEYNNKIKRFQALYERILGNKYNSTRVLQQSRLAAMAVYSLIS